MKSVRHYGAISRSSRRPSTAFGPTSVGMFLLLIALLALRSMLPSRVLVDPDPVYRREQPSRLSMAATCAKDYEPCAGGLPSPVAMMPCCSSAFYCFRRGPYFSQCRPAANDSNKQLQHSQRIHASKDRLFGRFVESPRDKSKIQTTTASRVRLCAPDYGVCAAGAGSDSSIPCCNHPFFKCALSTPFYHQCLPASTGSSPDASNPRKHRTVLYYLPFFNTTLIQGRWFRLRTSTVSGFPKQLFYTFLSLTMSPDPAVYQAVTAAEKLQPLIYGMNSSTGDDMTLYAGVGMRRADLLSLPENFDPAEAKVVVTGILPSQSWRERKNTRLHVENCLPPLTKLLSISNGRVLVQCRYPQSVDVAMSLATLSEIRELSLRFQLD